MLIHHSNSQRPRNLLGKINWPSVWGRRSSWTVAALPVEGFRDPLAASLLLLLLYNTGRVGLSLSLGRTSVAFPFEQNKQNMEKPGSEEVWITAPGGDGIFPFFGRPGVGTHQPDSQMAVNWSRKKPGFRAGWVPSLSRQGRLLTGKLTEILLQYYISLMLQFKFFNLNF